jgi:hypothetical protein
MFADVDGEIFEDANSVEDSIVDAGKMERLSFNSNKRLTDSLSPSSKLADQFQLG